ncbi:MAG TPA: hypothetical protein VN257_10880, partial [Actinotalea sp.]|nr:hypothetical protein [Actinotalea sp.]
MGRDLDGPGTDEGPRAARAALATVLCGTLTALLVLAGRAMAAATLPLAAPLVRVDGLVGLGVVGVGVAAGAVLTTGSLLLTASVLGPARWAGPLAAAARRLTPTVLRRAVAVGLGTGLGLLGPSGPTWATEIDLGWAVTTEAPAATGAVRPEPAPAGSPVTPSPGPTPSPVRPAG